MESERADLRLDWALYRAEWKVRAPGRRAVGYPAKLAQGGIEVPETAANHVAASASEETVCGGAAPRIKKKNTKRKPQQISSQRGSDRKEIPHQLNGAHTLA